MGYSGPICCLYVPAQSDTQSTISFAKIFETFLSCLCCCVIKEVTYLPLLLTKKIGFLTQRLLVCWAELSGMKKNFVREVNFINVIYRITINHVGTQIQWLSEIRWPKVSPENVPISSNLHMVLLFRVKLKVIPALLPFSRGGVGGRCSMISRLILRVSL